MLWLYNYYLRFTSSIYSLRSTTDSGGTIGVPNPRFHGKYPIYFTFSWPKGADFYSVENAKVMNTQNHQKLAQAVCDLCYIIQIAIQVLQNILWILTCVIYYYTHFAMSMEILFRSDPQI